MSTQQPDTPTGTAADRDARRTGLDDLLAHVAANLPAVEQAPGTCGRALSTRQPCPDHPTDDANRVALLDGRDALAFVVIRPAGDGTDAVTVEASSRGMPKSAAAYTLRATADQFDEAARAEGDTPIPYPPAVDDEQPHPHPTRRVLTDDEYDAAHAAACAAVPAVDSFAVQDAMDAALLAVGILPPPPTPAPDTCDAMFADHEGVWHQCAQDPDHDPADGHDSGEWAWPDGQMYATPEPDEADDQTPAEQGEPF